MTSAFDPEPLEQGPLPAGPLQEGVYERIVDERLAAALSALEAGERLRPTRRKLADSEAGDRLGMHLAGIVERAIADLPERKRAAAGIALVRELVDALARQPGQSERQSEAPVEAGTVLHAVTAKRPDGSWATLTPPLVPLLDSTLLTNSPGEPRVLAQLLSEVPTAARIDVVMAFVRRSGVRPLRDALRRHCAEGRGLRVLTTTYTGSTEAAALDDLVDLGAEVRVSYDVTATRLHAKSWLFDRGLGVATAYVGSSNMTHSAQVTGIEWIVRASSARNRALVDKLRAVFDSYWESGDFVAYERAEFEARMAAGRTAAADAAAIPPTEVRLEAFQERLLADIQCARDAGQHANLLVSATGTGKTVMAAVDYLRLRARLRPARLLFVAHRKELLEQARATFRHALRDPAFGELWVDGARPARWEHVFASVSSLAAAGYADLDPRRFDVVIVDECHHGPAESYRALLDHVRPVELLGLTATPERADGASVLERFGGRITAELRLWDAIEQQRLVPFLYYGVHDGTDLRRIGWTRGRGYDTEGLTNIYTQDDRWAHLVLDQLRARVDDLREVRALGFCASVAHARFMARKFSERGLPAVAVSGETPQGERRQALADLRDRAVNVVFSVDLFNEGVDVPQADTLLLLRPTESPTLFLQQLGRGLRRAAGKHACVVLDFVGHHRQEFRFDRRLGALLGVTRHGLVEQVERGFPFLPAGCHLELDAVAQHIVLRSLKNALPATQAQRAAKLRALAATRGADVSLAEFLAETGLALDDVYANTRCWSDLREAAGLPTRAPRPATSARRDEEQRALRRALGRLLHVDDEARCADYLALVSQAAAPRRSAHPSAREARVARQLTAQLLSRGVTDKATTLDEGLALLWAHPQVLAELRELFECLRGRASRVARPIRELPDVPLGVHARYTRFEILAAFDERDLARAHAWQTGVYWQPKARADLLAFTLDKSSGGFSPTTRYRDYALSPNLIHWESQSITRADSETGLRYQRHVERGSSVLLFARERADDRAFWFLGPARYVKHDGERPMAITWRLEHPLSNELFTRFAAAAV
ncbi:MAG: DUF3427 domain-containing protein [Planctomycetota bacterium]